MNHRLPILFVAAIFLLSSCASPSTYNHLDVAARPLIDNVDTYLVVVQEEIYAGTFDSNVYGDYRETYQSYYPGENRGDLLSELIVASVDDSRNKDAKSNAELFVEPIREELSDYDFAQVLKTKIDGELKQIEWLHAKDLVVLRTAEKNMHLNKCAASKASATLFVGAKYWLSPDLSRIYTKVNLIMFPNTKDLEPHKEKIDNNENPVNDTDNIYKTQYTAAVPFKIEGLVKNRGKILARNGGQKIKTALEACAEKVSAFIAKDIVREEPATSNNKL
jgi:hypothetical protein